MIHFCGYRGGEDDKEGRDDSQSAEDLHYCGGVRFFNSRGSGELYVIQRTGNQVDQVWTTLIHFLIVGQP